MGAVLSLLNPIKLFSKCFFHSSCCGIVDVDMDIENGNNNSVYVKAGNITYVKEPNK